MVDYYSYSKARAVVRKLKIRTVSEYLLRCNEDSRLPSTAEVIYEDYWVSWDEFLEGGFYLTYGEACGAAKSLGCRAQSEYAEKYGKDPRLPPDPHLYYKSQWGGWCEYLGVFRHYSYEEAKEVVQRMGISSCNEYADRYKEDLMLPSTPNKKYASEGWVDWYDFCGKKGFHGAPTLRPRS